MDSMKVLGSTFLDNHKKRKKKKAKKTKREKLDKQKSKPKDQQSLKDYADICDSNLFAQWPEIKKKKRKKKPDVSLNEEFPLTQNKNLNLSKGHKQNRKGNCVVDTHTVEHGVESGHGEQEKVQPILNSIQKEKKHKRRVVFNLSPVLLEPKPLQNPFVVRDILQTQCSGTDKKPSFNSIFPADGRHSKPAMEENGTESQSTSDDINSQDLFITQKSFSDPYIDLCSSTSAEEALEPQGYTASSPRKRSCPEHQSYTASSPRKQSCPEHQSYTASSPRKQSCPEPQSYTASSPRKQSCPEHQSYTASSPGKQSCPEHQSYTASSPRKRSCPEHQSYTASSPRKQSCPEHQSYTASSPRKRSCPEHQSYTASSPRKRSRPEHQSYTASSPRKWSCPEPQSLPKKTCPAYHPSPPRKPSHCHKLDASTQTENFFTSPLLATSLRFRHWSTCTEVPMDLSLPKRSRLLQWEGVSKASEDQHHPELNVTDLTQSDDSDSHLKSKADLSQLKVVQTRLNESFFFKLKGEGDSPKPMSPLMKFAGSGEKKKP
ncbi:protein SCAF11 [Pangasianodon hypophthalmus]|uniref:protein SCAF11 n=1 Tax=Pangasianodon hypophthalmus TaxID=310915 RepID=UPI0023074C04|nr:protein SCAF11 [Pangasianodon hypophthalmus]